MRSPLLLLLLLRASLEIKQWTLLSLLVLSREWVLKRRGNHIEIVSKLLKTRFISPEGLQEVD